MIDTYNNTTPLHPIPTSYRSVTEECIEAMGRIYTENVYSHHEPSADDTELQVSLPFPRYQMHECCNPADSLYQKVVNVKKFDDSIIKLPIDSVIMARDKSYCAYWLDSRIESAIFGHVMHARVLIQVSDEWHLTNQECAVKVMHWSYINDEYLRNVHENPLMEVSAMQFMLCMDMSDNVMTALEIMSDECSIFIVMPYFKDGDLFSCLEQTHYGYHVDEARYWFSQIVNGVNELHRAGICHRDLSLENILVNGDKCAITDFGLCLRVADPIQGHSRSNKKRPLIAPQGACGKDYYMAPEIYENDRKFDPFASDVWSLGVILFMMITGSVPFELPSPTDKGYQYIIINSNLRKVLYSWGRSDLYENYELMDILERMLDCDPRQRIELEDVIHHPWMTKEFS